MLQQGPRTDRAHVVVFDLDGTITRHDTLVPFLLGWLRRRPTRWWRLWRVPFAVACYAAGRSDRGTLKSSLLRSAMGRARRAEVETWARDFTGRVLAGGCLPGALDAIRRHRARGDYLVLLSASVDCYVPEIGRRLGFDETICTGVRWSDERLDGHLTTANRRGTEKQRVVAELRQRFPAAHFTAYANARSDFEHLRTVDEPHLVNASRSTRAAARRLGITGIGWR